MLESLIGWLINRHLKTLLAEYTSGAHDLTFTDGRLQLNDLSLRTDVVAGLDLPLVVVSAHVKQLELMLPWSTDDGTTAAPDGATVVSDGHRAVVVRCDGVTLVLQPHTEAAHVPGLREEVLQRRRQRRLQADVTAAKSAADAERRAIDPAPPPLNGAQQQALIDTFLRSLQLSLSNVCVRYEEESGGAAAELRLDALHIRCRRERARGGGLWRLLSGLFGSYFGGWFGWGGAPRRLSHEQECIVELELVTGVRWRPLPTAEPLWVLRPLTFKAETVVELWWPPRSAGDASDGGDAGEGGDGAPASSTAGGGDRPRLRLNATAELHQIHLDLRPEQLSMALLAVSRLVHCDHFERYRDLRPRAPILPSNGAPPGGLGWWRYACRAVARDLALERLERSPQVISARLQAVQRYEEALRQKWRDANAPPPSIEELEEEIELEGLLEVRTRVRDALLAKEGARGGGGGSGAHSIRSSLVGAAGLERMDVR